MKKIWLLTCVIPLSACSLWDSYKKPLIEEPEQWATPPDVPLQQSFNDVVPQAWPDADWWKQFGSPRLDSMVDSAQTANLDLKAAIARIREADAQARIAGAPLLPEVDLAGNATRTRSGRGAVSTLNPANPTVTSGRGPHYSTDLNATLSASYELDFWGKNWAGAESARLLAEASRYDKETVKLVVLSTLADNYFDTLATQARLTLANNNLAVAEQLLDAIQKRYNQGLQTGLDVAQQESVTASVRTAIPPLELHLRQDLDAQAILLGLLPEKIDLPVENFDSMGLPSVSAGLPSELLVRRPDVQEAEAQLASAHADIVQARAQFFPSISLTAQGGYESAALSHLFEPGSLLLSVGAGLAQPIFEGGRLTGQLEFAKARYDELLQNYRKVALSAFADVEDSLASVQQTAAQEEAQRLATIASRQAFALTQQQLTGGIIDVTTVLNTQRTLFASEDALLQARLAHLQAIVSLYKALGGGWKTDNSDKNELVKN